MSEQEMVKRECISCKCIATVPIEIANAGVISGDIRCSFCAGDTIIDQDRRDRTRYSFNMIQHEMEWIVRNLVNPSLDRENRILFTQKMMNELKKLEELPCGDEHPRT